MNDMLSVMQTYRHTLALACAALAIVSLALAARLGGFDTRPITGFLGITHNNTLETDSSFYKDNMPKQSKAPEIPVTAKAYLVGNVKTGKIYLEKNSTHVLPVASMSKLITAIAAIDILKPDGVVTITDDEMAITDVASDTAKLQSGEKFKVSELLYPMLLNSSNLAAEALASSSDRDKFVKLMEGYANEIGMPSTYFADPSGIDPRNSSSAKDFFALAQYLYKLRPDILAVTRTSLFQVATTSDHGAHDFVSIHPFVTNPDFIGGKTGHTSEAGDTMLTIIKVSGEPIAVIVLGANTGSRAADTGNLIAELKSELATRN